MTAEKANARAAVAPPSASTTVGGTFCEHNTHLLLRAQQSMKLCKICGVSAVRHHMGIKYRCKDCDAQAGSTTLM
jgi:hypothetical protein